MLALRADGKSVKTPKTYRESADQLIAFLASPPPVPEETANLLDAARLVTGPGDITATHLRAFMGHLPRLHKPATANKRYRGCSSGSGGWQRRRAPGHGQAEAVQPEQG